MYVHRRLVYNVMTVLVTVIKVEHNLECSSVGEWTNHDGYNGILVSNKMN